MLEALGNLGDFIGGVAVVATLLYLALQVRQNTASVHAASRQDVVESFRNVGRQLVNVDGIAELTLDGLRRYPDLEQPGRIKFVAFIADHGLHFQGAFALYESGALEEETYRAYLDFFAGFLATPGGAAFWSEYRSSFPPRMSVAVDDRLAAGGLPNILEMPSYRAE
jgi:hypothetical protein